MGELERRAGDAGEPVARLAARIVVAQITENGSVARSASAVSTYEDTEADLDRHARPLDEHCGVARMADVGANARADLTTAGSLAMAC
jgi:hypothetical protein